MEDNAFQTLTWLNLKGPKLLQTDNERCPAAKHRRAQKHKLCHGSISDTQNLPASLTSYTAFISTQLESPTWPQAVI